MDAGDVYEAYVNQIISEIYRVRAVPLQQVDPLACDFTNKRCPDADIQPGDDTMRRSDIIRFRGKWYQNDKEAVPEQMAKQTALARFKRRVTAWPHCRAGGSVSVVWNGNDAYFYCDKCGENRGSHGF